MDTYSLPLQTVKLICNCDNISRGETAGDCCRQTKTHLFLTSRTGGAGGEGKAKIFNILSLSLSPGIIKEAKLAADWSGPWWIVNQQFMSPL